MEKFYTVKKDSKLWDEYWQYQNDQKAFTAAFHTFAEQNGITSSKAYMTTGHFWIIPDAHDKEMFAGQFMKNEPGKFKKASPIGKKWDEFCKENNVPYPHRPFVQFWFDNYSSARSRLFDLNDVLYCTFESKTDFTASDELVEVKASDFYLVMEKNNIKL